MIDLVGENIENPGNANVMLQAARMFGCGCFFSGATEHPDIAITLSPGALSADYKPIVAMENGDGSQDVYSFKVRSGDRLALLAGNERRGISSSFKSMANQLVQIPMTSKLINCLNVAAASGVTLYYLQNQFGRPMQKVRHPEKRRPELLLVGGNCHVELGSAIRSATAFGWSRVLLDDSAGIWFGCDRVTRSEGRAAARRARNPVRLVKVSPDNQYMFDQVAVVSAVKQEDSMPLSRANLAGGSSQLVVVPDESTGFSAANWERLGRSIKRIHIEIPQTDFAYHYRIIASIVMAEISRQVGEPEGVRQRRRQTGPVYDSSLAAVLALPGEDVTLEDLLDY